MQTFPTPTLERDGTISKDLRYKDVHSWFFELASSTALASERSWTFDLALQEVAQVCTNNSREMRNFL